MTRAAAAFSNLFEDPEAAAALEGSEIPAYFGDLNLDQVVDAVIAGRAEYRLAPFFGLPLSDERAVRYRQGVFRDLEAGLSEAVACAVICGQSVRFTAGSEGMGLERRSVIAEHRCPITTPASSRSWVASPRQPVDGIVTIRATRWSCTTRLGSLIRGHDRPPEEVTLAV